MKVNPSPVPDRPLGHGGEVGEDVSSHHVQAGLCQLQVQVFQVVISLSHGVLICRAQAGAGDGRLDAAGTESARVTAQVAPGPVPTRGGCRPCCACTCQPSNPGLGKQILGSASRCACQVGVAGCLFSLEGLSWPGQRSLMLVAHGQVHQARSEWQL